MLAMPGEETLNQSTETALIGKANSAELSNEINNRELENDGIKSVARDNNMMNDEENEMKDDQPIQESTSGEAKVPSFKTDDAHLIKEQLKYCAIILKGLRRHRDGSPFLLPVDPIVLGIPDYPSIIKNPMDLSTIGKKLDGAQYANADEFAADVRLMLNNCFAFNAADSQVNKMGRNLEKYFSNCLLKMPTNMEQAAALSASSPSRGTTPNRASAQVVARPRRESTTPTGRRGSNAGMYSAPASAGKTGKRPSGDITFCRQVLTELCKKTHQHINWPFLQPVDPASLGIPDYFEVIKHPMDLSTIRHKLDAKEYLNAEQFESDVRLVFSNCNAYNAPDTDIVQMAKALESIFESKWAQRPIKTPSNLDSIDDDEERILAISQQISALQVELNMLLMRRKGSKSRSASIPASAMPIPSGSAGAKPKKPSFISPQQLEEELSKPMTFEEKRQLSNDVNNLPPEKLIKVVEIIHDSMPNLKENADSDVIELDVESLDVRTLRKLQRYVRECSKKRKVKPAGAVSKKTHTTSSQPQPTAPEAAPFPVESSDDSSEESGDD